MVATDPPRLAKPSLFPYRVVTRHTCFGLGLIVMACTPASPAAGGGPASAPPSPTGPKSITIGVTVPVAGYEPWRGGTTTGGSLSTSELHVNGLVTSGAHGGYEPRVAAKLPSLDGWHGGYLDGRPYADHMAPAAGRQMARRRGDHRRRRCVWLAGHYRFA